MENQMCQEVRGNILYGEGYHRLASLSLCFLFPLRLSLGTFYISFIVDDFN